MASLPIKPSPDPQASSTLTSTPVLFDKVSTNFHSNVQGSAQESTSSKIPYSTQNSGSSVLRQPACIPALDSPAKSSLAGDLSFSQEPSICVSHKSLPTTTTAFGLHQLLQREMQKGPMLEAQSMHTETTTATNATTQPVCNTNGSAQNTPARSSTKKPAKSPELGHECATNAVAALLQIRKSRRCHLLDERSTMTKLPQTSTSGSCQKPGPLQLVNKPSTTPKSRPKEQLTSPNEQPSAEDSKTGSERTLFESSKRLPKQLMTRLRSKISLTQIDLAVVLPALNNGPCVSILVLTAFFWSIFPVLALSAAPYLALASTLSTVLAWFLPSGFPSIYAMLSNTGNMPDSCFSDTAHRTAMYNDMLYFTTLAAFLWTFVDWSNPFAQPCLLTVYALSTIICFLVPTRPPSLTDHIDESPTQNEIEHSIDDRPTQDQIEHSIADVAVISPQQSLSPSQEWHSEIRSFEHFFSGGTHDVYLVNFEPDGMTEEQMTQHPEQIPDELILRIRRPDCDATGAATAVKNEVGIRHHIYTQLGDDVPTPRVYAWSDGSCEGWETMENPPADNSSGCPAWIAEEYVQGQQLCYAWGSLTSQQRLTILKQLAQILVGLGKSRFTGIGALDVEKIGLTPHSELSMVTGSRWRWWDDKFYDIGPYRTTRKYVVAMIEKEIMFLSHTNAEELDWNEGIWGTVDDFREGYLSDKLQHFSNPEESHFWGHEPFTICHGDIAGRNILVDGTKITAILDWEEASILPLSENLNSGLKIRQPIDFTCKDPAHFPDDVSADKNANLKAHKILKRHMGMEARKRGWSDDDVNFLLADFSHEGVALVREEIVPWNCADFVPDLKNDRSDFHGETASEQIQAMDTVENGGMT